MSRTIQIALNKFGTIPPTLLSGMGAIVAEVPVPLDSLFHHYFISKFGEAFPDPGVYEYRPMLTSGPDFRFRRNGIGADKESRGNVSNELGKALARWFLHAHLNFAYFCPLEDLLDRRLPDGTKWTRRAPGDLPDFVCGPTQTAPHLMEAKGRYRAVGFTSAAFETFRSQLRRARLLDALGQELSVKGYTCVGRWATETRPRLRTSLSVEDPLTPGKPPPANTYPPSVGWAMIAGHYAQVLDCLRLRTHAEALRSGSTLPERTGVRRGLWRCISGALSGRRFVGGLIPSQPGPHGCPYCDSWHGNPFILHEPTHIFGLEESIWSRVMGLCHRGLEAAAGIVPLVPPEGAIGPSFLRDGTVLGSSEYFEPEDPVTV